MNMIHFLLNILFIVSPHILFNHLDTDADVNYTISNITEDTFSKNAEIVRKYSFFYFIHSKFFKKVYFIL